MTPPITATFRTSPVAAERAPAPPAPPTRATPAVAERSALRPPTPKPAPAGTAPAGASAIADAAAGVEHQRLRRGSTGAPVANLQAKLNDAGAGLDVDGKFGARTQAAVERYQRTRELEVDGIVGPQTRAALAARAPAAPAAAAPPATGATDVASKNVSTDGLSLNSRSVLAKANAPEYGLHLISGVAARGNVSDHPAGNAVDVSNGALTPQMRSFADDIRGKPGVKYVIYDNQIASAKDDWAWRPYTHPSGGSNPTLDHEDHVHVSVT